MKQLFEWHSMYYDAGIICIAALIIFLFLRKKRFERNTKMQVVWFLSGMIAIGAFVAQIIMGVSAVKDYQQVIAAYQEGNYKTVVGEVEKFTTLTPEENVIG